MTFHHLSEMLASTEMLKCQLLLLLLTSALPSTPTGQINYAIKFNSWEQTVQLIKINFSIFLNITLWYMTHI